MPPPRVTLPPAVVAGAAPTWEDLRQELHVPDGFGPEVLAEAAAAAAAPRMARVDQTDLPLFTVDPEGSRDLDQAVAIERRPGGYRVSYAIADVAAFVVPGGAVDVEAHRRAVTLYAPDRKVPLHPTVLSEGAASLLPGVDRPAVLWVLELDRSAELVSTAVGRARVRSRRRLSYTEVQRALDGGDPDEQLTLLREVGRLRQARAAERGAAAPWPWASPGPTTRRTPKSCRPSTPGCPPPRPC